MKLVAGFAVVAVIIVVVVVIVYSLLLLCTANTLRFNHLPGICQLNNLQRVILG